MKYDPIVAYCHAAPPKYIKAASFSSRSVECSPYISTVRDGNNFRSIQLPRGRFDLAATLAVLPPSQKPEAVIVWTDASQVIMPENLAALDCRKILLLGDIHHMSRPIQTMLDYCTSQTFDTIILDRGKAHFFAEAGCPSLFWMQFPHCEPTVYPVRPDRRPDIVLVGQVGPLHPRRRRIITMLEERGYPVRPARCRPDEGYRLYNECQISLNISLNGDPNYRFAEIPAAGGFLLTDRLAPQAGVEMYYTEDEHYAAYGSVEELCAKLDYYLARPDECLRIARQGQARYFEMLNRPKLVQHLWEMVFENKAPPFLDLEAEPRFAAHRVIGRERLRTEIGIYEFIQERHRVQERVTLLIRPGVPLMTVINLGDLHRLEIVIESEDGLDPATRAEFERMQIAGRVRTCPSEAARKQRWDVVMASYAVDAAGFDGAYLILAADSSEPPGHTRIEPDLPIFACPPRPATIARSPDPMTQRRLADRTELPPMVIDFLLTAANEAGFIDKDVLEIGPVVPPEAAIDDLEARHWVAVSHRGDPAATLPPEDIPAPETLTGHAFVNIAVERLGVAYNRRFDTVLSIGALQKAPVLGETLQRISLLLRPGGTLFAVALPVWASPMGWRGSEPQTSDGAPLDLPEDLIDPWDHLLLTPDAMLTKLRGRYPIEQAAEIVRFIYASPDQNRLFVEDYIESVQNSRLDLVEIGLIGEVPPSPQIQAALEARWPGRKYFGNFGIMIIARRPE